MSEPVPSVSPVAQPAEVLKADQAKNPYPGLRPFERYEADIFFGREEHIGQVLAALGKTRFVAVIGTSGSGKSSLVRAGVIPALEGDLLIGATSHWRIGIFRPEATPIANLAKTLRKMLALKNPSPADILRLQVIETTLKSSSEGLIDVVKEANLSTRENILLVVDQFEELFRYEQEDESEAFVKRLLAATADKSVAVYVIITMRSDFLGHCSQFEGLPEAVNTGLYLIPRLSRTELKRAIENPLRMTTGSISAGLVQRLLNDVSKDPDQLPVLQHALMRSWNGSQRIDPKRYEDIGGTQKALANHADRILIKLGSETRQKTAELLFKCLTAPGPDQQGIRSPMRLDGICRSTRRSRDEVTYVIDMFRGPKRALLMPPLRQKLKESTSIDIAHESLIRKWDRLGEWVKEEAASAQIYQDLCRAAEAAEKDGELLGEKRLPYILEVKRTGSWNRHWAKRYGGDYSKAIRYLRTSCLYHRARRADIARAEEEARGRQLQEEESERQRQIDREERERAFRIREEEAARKLEHEKKQNELRQLRLKWKVAGGLALVTAIAWAVILWTKGESVGRTLAMATFGEKSRYGGPPDWRVPAALASYRFNQLYGTDEGFDPMQRIDHWEEFAALTKPEWTEASSPVLKNDDSGIDELSPVAVTSGWSYLAMADRSTVRIWAIGEEGKPQGAGTSFSFEGDVNKLSWSQDERPELAVGTRRNALHILDAQTKAPVRLAQFEAPIEELGFDQTGSILFSLAKSGRLFIHRRQSSGWKVDENGEQLARLGVKGRLSPNGRFLGIVDRDNVIVYELQNGRPRRTLGPIPTLLGSYLSFSPASTHIAVGTERGLLRVWELGGKTQTPQQWRMDYPVSTVSFSPDAKYIAVGSLAVGEARIYELGTDDKQPLTVLSHFGSVTAIQFSRDSNHVATASEDGKARLFETFSGRETRRVTHESPVTKLAMSSTDDRLLSGSINGTIHLSFPAKSEGVSAVRDWAIDASDRPMKCVQSTTTLSAEAKEWAGSCDGTIWIKYTSNTKDSFKTLEKIKLSGEEAHARFLAISEDGTLLAVADQHSWTTPEIHLVRRTDAGWKEDAMVLKPTPGGQQFDAITTLAVSPDGRRVAWSTNAYLEVHTANGTTDKTPLTTPLSSLVFLGREKLAAGGNDGKVRLYEVEPFSHEPVEVKLHIHKQPVTALAYNAKGGYLISAAQDGTAIISQRGKEDPLFHEGRLGNAHLAAFSKDGSRAALAIGTKIQTFVKTAEGNFKTSVTLDEYQYIQALAVPSHNRVTTSTPTSKHYVTALTHQLALQPYFDAACQAQPGGFDVLDKAMAKQIKDFGVSRLPRPICPGLKIPNY